MAVDSCLLYPGFDRWFSWWIDQMLELYLKLCGVVEETVHTQWRTWMHAYWGRRVCALKGLTYLHWRIPWNTWSPNPWLDALPAVCGSTVHVRDCFDRPPSVHVTYLWQWLTFEDLKQRPKEVRVSTPFKDLDKAIYMQGTIFAFMIVIGL